MRVQTIQEQVVDSLRRLILDGDYAPGDKLSQDELAGRLGVSPMPVREGLRQLQSEGLVTFTPRHGASVAALSPAEFDELYHIREELEALALGWALERLDAPTKARLRAGLAQIESAEADGDVHRRTTVVRDFLWTLFEAAGRPHLLAAIRRYYNMTYLYQRQYSALLALGAARTQIYRRLLEAIEAGDRPAALAAHRDNYRLIREAMLPLLQSADAPIAASDITDQPSQPIP